MSKSRALRLFPLGVDLVEMTRARSFYEAHKDHLGSFFSSREVSDIRQSRKPHERLAVYLAAKEAVYKALRAKRAGMLGFRNIGISRSGSRLVCDSDKALRLSWMKNNDFAVVECRKD